METRRLRTVQQPSELESLLESYVQSANILPGGAYQIRDAAGVPRELRAILTRAAENGQTWACWTHGVYTWLFTCEMSLALSRERGSPVLQVSLYGDDGGLKDSGTWMRDGQGKWLRCAD